MNPISNNPPATATTITALLVVFLTDLTNYIAEIIDIPQTLETSGTALVLGLIGFGIGKIAQRYTWPDWKIQAELIAPVEDEDHWSVPITEVQDYTEEA